MNILDFVWSSTYHACLLGASTLSNGCADFEWAAPPAQVTERVPSVARGVVLGWTLGLVLGWTLGPVLGWTLGPVLGWALGPVLGW